jgi:class 3 adenylate cyclase/tetratricopeptide (TPR) repeat protein
VDSKRVERKLAAIMFTDIVGYTAVMAESDEAGLRVRSRHRELVRPLVEQYHGEWIEERGDESLSSFQSAVDAVNCALATQSELQDDPELQLRIGIHVGEILAEGDHVYGDGINVASRVRPMAEPGGICISEAVCQLVRNQPNLKTSPLGQHQLKNVPQPIGLCAIWGTPNPPSKLLPSLRRPADGRRAARRIPAIVGGRTAETPFVGRAEVLERLETALEDALAGLGRIVLLTGEPGIGKTRTATEFAASAHARGVSVYSSWCYEGEGAPPYWPWVQLLRAVTEERDPEVLRAKMGAGGADIAQIVPELRELWPDREAPASPEPKEARFRLFGSVSSFLERVAEDEPLLLIIDDLHRADSASLELLGLVAHDISRLPILLVGTYRDVEVDREHLLTDTLAELIRRDVFERSRLEGLTADAVHELVTRLSGGDSTPDLSAAILERTDGNPFFITQLLLHRAAVRGHERGEEATRGLDLPPGVRDVIRGTLRRLSAVCNEALAVASVIGRDFSLDVLEWVTGSDAEVLAEQIDQARKAGLVSMAPGGGLRFAHSLIREILYAEQGLRQRSRLHWRVAQALERHYGADVEPHLSQLSYHFCEASVEGDADKAIHYATRAGDRAMDMLAFEEASSQYRDAIQALQQKAATDVGARLELLLKYGRACNWSGDYLGAREAYLSAAELARNQDDATGMASAALGYSEEPVVTLNTETVRLLEEALAALPPHDTPLRARLMAQLAEASYFVDERRYRLSQEALEMARRSDDPDALALALRRRHWCLSDPDSVGERLPVSTELLQLADRTGNRLLLLQAHRARLADLLELGDIAGMDAEYAAFENLASAQRQPYYLWEVELLRAMRLHMAGDLTETEAQMGRALAIGLKTHAGAAQIFNAIQTYALCHDRGRLVDCEEMMRELAPRFPEQPWTLGVALAALERRNQAEARELLGRFLRERLPRLSRDVHRLISLALAAEVSARLSAAEACAVLYPVLAPYEKLHVTIGIVAVYRGAVARYLGLLASTLERWDEAARHFERALERETRIGARPFAAYAQCDYGQMLLERGEPGLRREANDRLEAASKLAQQIGMPHVCARVEELRKARS